MVKGTRIQRFEKPQVNYRELDALNYSMLKKFDEDPVKFFEEFKLGKKKKYESKDVAAILGDLSDFYVLECEGDEDIFNNRFDEKYVLFEGSKGTQQVFLLADFLFDATEQATNEEGEVTVSFEERFKEAIRRVNALDKYSDKKSPTGFKSYEQILEDFEKKGLEYYQKRLDNIGKIVVEISLVEKARTISNNILTDPFTRHLFYKDDNVEVLNHFPIEWKYTLGEGKFIRCKSEIDRLAVDHANKIIYPLDLKTTYDNEIFSYSYLKRSYYIQATFYYFAVIHWLQEQGEAMKDYIVMPMQFIVGDTSSNNRRPLIYFTSIDDLTAGQFGFEIRGQKYRGVDELIKDIAWAEANNEWRCSKEAADNQGKMTLNIKYE